MAWLAARGLPPPEAEDASAALARHGITDVDAWITARDRREAELGRALDEARADRAVALRSANAYALVAVLLAAIAIGGWLAAFGGFPASELVVPPPAVTAPRPLPESP